MVRVAFMPNLQRQLLSTSHPVRVISKACFQHDARSGAVQTRDLAAGLRCQRQDPG